MAEIGSHGDGWTADSTATLFDNRAGTLMLVPKYAVVLDAFASWGRSRLSCHRGRVRAAVEEQ